MVTRYAVTGNIADFLGNTVGASQAVLYVRNNVPAGKALFDVDGNVLHPPGASRLTVGSDGTVTASLIATNSPGINVPDGALRWEIFGHVYDDAGHEQPWTSGPFELTTNRTLAQVAGTGSPVDVDASSMLVATLVEQAMQDHTPGTLLGIVNRASPAITSTAASVGAATPVAGLSLTITGQGRSVEVHLRAPMAYSSTANVPVSVMLVRDGNTAHTDNQYAPVFSPLTNAGPSLDVATVTDPIPIGVVAVFTVRVWTSSGSTAVLFPQANYRIQLIARSL